MSTADPPGWRVRRRWMPRLGSETLDDRAQRRVTRVRRRLRKMGDADVGGLDGCALDGIEGLVIAIVVIVVAVVLALVVVPLLVALVDVVVLVLLAVLGLAARVLFRRPWLVDAHHDDGHGLRWRVVGWRASSEKVAEVRQQLAAGIEAPDAEVLLAPPPDPQPE